METYIRGMHESKGEVWQGPNWVENTLGLQATKPMTKLFGFSLQVVWDLIW